MFTTFSCIVTVFGSHLVKDLVTTLFTRGHVITKIHCNWNFKLIIMDMEGYFLLMVKISLCSINLCFFLFYILLNTSGSRCGWYDERNKEKQKEKNCKIIIMCIEFIEYKYMENECDEDCLICCPWDWLTAYRKWKMYDKRM